MINWEFLKGYLHPEPSLIYAAIFSVALVSILLNQGISEATGSKHLQYSKFWTTAKSGKSKVSGKIGMLMFYTPPLLVGISSFLLFPGGDVRFLMLKSAITFHFLKRDLEVLFLHKISSSVVIGSIVNVNFFYISCTAGMIYFHNLAQKLPEPSVDLKYIGLSLFLVGNLGNFYHHSLLAKLRNKSDEGYKIPTGGLFNFVTCPHYLFEIIAFVGFSFISQTLFSYASALSSIVLLVGRSYATRKWYLSKFDDFPKSVKALIPFVF